jgi:hypothetical protein
MLFKYMFQRFRVELIPRATGNGYRNMQIEIVGRECVIAVCLQTTRSPVTVF